MQGRILMLGVAALLAIGAIWEAAVRAFNVPSFLLPPPSVILAELAGHLPLYLQESVSTLLATVLGFLLAAAVGVGLGSLIAYSWILRGLLYPPILVLQVVPKVALAPILIVWVGFGLPSRVLMAAIISFFPIVMNTVVGLTSVEPDLLDLVRGLGGSRTQEFVKIAFPHALSFIFSGFKVAITLSVIGTVVAEFIGGNNGLGYLILVGNADLNVARSFAALILLSVMGFGLFGAIALVERLCASWTIEERQDGRPQPVET